MRQKRHYLQYCEKSLNAIQSAISVFNNVYDKHKIETALILTVNAWELLGKAILLKSKISILDGRFGNTIPAEKVLLKLKDSNILDENQSEHIQQLISLRNEAVHGVLPDIPLEILHHLFYFSCKFYKDIIIKKFPQYKNIMVANFLSISFDELTTYAEKVQKLAGRMRKGNQTERKLIWLLERGVRFEGNEYISQDQFEKEFKSKKKRKILPHLELNKFIKGVDMVRIVPIQAPKNYTADLTLRKGKNSDSSLPVFIKKTDVESDYPYLTGEIATKLGRSSNYIAIAIKKLNIKGNPQYHQAIRSSKNSIVNRYSDAILHFLRDFLRKNPDYNPYAKS